MRSEDFSLFALFMAGFSALAQCYTQPTGKLGGNAIQTPAKDEIVPVGNPYNITWNPTTEGTVTLLLLRGPATNIKPLYPIVERIKNDGSCSWTPSTKLEDDVTHYAIQVVVDATGDYQYSSQFGISNPNGPSPSPPGSVKTPSPDSAKCSGPDCAKPPIYPKPPSSSPSSCPSGSKKPAYTPSLRPGNVMPTGSKPNPYIRPTGKAAVPTTTPAGGAVQVTENGADSRFAIGLGSVFLGVAGVVAMF